MLKAQRYTLFFLSGNVHDIIATEVQVIDSTFSWRYAGMWFTALAVRKVESSW